METSYLSVCADRTFWLHSLEHLQEPIKLMHVQIWNWELPPMGNPSPVKGDSWSVNASFPDSSSYIAPQCPCINFSSFPILLFPTPNYFLDSSL